MKSDTRLPRIVLFTPLDFRENHPTRWNRPNGLYCLEFRRLGLDATVVAYGASHEDSNRPISAASLSELSTPSWWKERSVTHAIMGGGLDPVLLPVYAATQAANVRTILVLDSGGCLVPERGCWGVFARDTITQYVDYRRRPGYVAVLLRLLYYAFFSHRIAERHLRFIGAADRTCTVSPLATRRVLKFLSDLGKHDLTARVAFVPHPVAVETHWEPSSRREKQVVAVGRWRSYAKNPHLLGRSLDIALRRFPDYRAHIVGSDVETIRRQLRNRGNRLAQQMVFHGVLNHTDLVELYRQSRIFLLPSRNESYNIAAAEALCCGCTLVTSSRIPTADWFCGPESGSMAEEYTAAALADALTVEMAMWDKGERDPDAISKRWTSEVGVANCAQRMLEAMGIRV